jgi:YVTN family beta-propeller protein
MTYSLGVDLGTTFVAAAIARPSGTEMVTLSGRSVVAPALVYLRDDGVLVTGEAARRRAVTAPERVGREFKRRLGDPTPIVLGGQAFRVTTLLGALLRDVLDQVQDLEGTAPEQVALTHPANWGGFRRGLFEEVPTEAGLGPTTTLTEPEAAAAHYAASRQLRDGQIVAVYDLGGGTFDATILRGGGNGVEILGHPEGIERLGGVDFDESILTYVNFSIGGVLNEIDLTDSATALAVARLRQDCIHAKESLSLDTEAIIPVFLPGLHTEVKLTRRAFEEMIRAPLESTMGALVRTVQSAGLESSDLSAVLLVGGSSRIPLVAEIISNELGCKTVVDTHPKYSVALGAATLADAALGLSQRQAASDVTTSPVRIADVAASRTRTVAAQANRAHGRTSARRGALGSLASADVSTTEAATSTGLHQPLNASAAKPTAATSAAPSTALPLRLRSETRESVARSNSPRTGDGSDRYRDDRAASAASGPHPPSKWEARASQRIRRPSGWVILAAVLLLVVFAGLWYVTRVGDHQSSNASGPRAGTASPALTGPPPTVKPAPAASLATPTVAGSFPVAAAPQAGAITPDGKLAYVTSTGTNSITVVDMATNNTVGQIPIAAGPPQYVAFTPDGRFAYVSVYDQIRNSGNVVAVIDTVSRKVVASVPTEAFPYALAVSPDGQQVFVPNHNFPAITVVDTKTNTVTREIAVKPSPHSVAFSTDGRRAYVANHFSNLVTVLDPSNGAILAEIPAGHSPHSIAVAPDRSDVYVADYDGNSVTVIDPVTNTVTATIPVGIEPQSVAFAPDSKHAYAVNDGNNTVSVIDTATKKVTATLTVGQDPTDVFVAADGKHAYVTNIGSDSVTVLNTG